MQDFIRVHTRQTSGSHRKTPTGSALGNINITGSRLILKFSPDLILKRWLPYLLYGTICGVLSILVFSFSFVSFKGDDKVETTSPEAGESTNATGFWNSFRKRADTSSALNTSDSKLKILLKNVCFFVSELLTRILHVLRNANLVLIILGQITEGVIIKGKLNVI
jgi:hypothetical protein